MAWQCTVYSRRGDENPLPENWHEIKLNVVFRDRFTCQMCGKKFKFEELDAHHLKPRSEGGTNNIKNLITLCEDCHDVVEVNGIRYRDIIRNKHRLQRDRQEKLYELKHGSKKCKRIKKKPIANKENWQT